MSAQPPYPPPPSRAPGYGGPRRVPVAAIAAVVVVLLVVVGGGAYWLGTRDDNGSSASPSTTPAASVQATGPASATAAAPSATGAAASSVSASSAPSASAVASQPDSSPAPTVTSPAPTVTSASPTPAIATTKPPVNPVPDFGYLRAVVTTNGVTTLTFDRAVLLTGTAAAAYAKAHNTELDDDYIIQNDNPLLRTWTVSPDVVVTGSIQLSGKVESTPSTMDALKAFIPAHTKSFLPVNLYYDKNDAVTKIAEVYFP